LATYLVLVNVDRLDFEVYADGGRLFGVEGVVRKPEEQRRLSDAALADDEQLERGQEGLGIDGHRSDRRKIVFVLQFCLAYASQSNVLAKSAVSGLDGPRCPKQSSKQTHRTTAQPQLVLG
jgi:hypothetical protein